MSTCAGRSSGDHSHDSRGFQEGAFRSEERLGAAYIVNPMLRLAAFLEAKQRLLNVLILRY